MRAQDWAYVCMQKATCAGRFLRAHSESFLGLTFLKYIYLLIKSYIFHFNISQVNLTFNWAQNQPWVLEFDIIGELGPE